MPGTTYERKVGELRVVGSLSLPIDMEFDVNTRALVDEAIEKGVYQVTLDLREVTYVSSQYLGAIAAIAVDMKKLGGGLVVMANPRMAKLMRTGGFDQVLTLLVE